MFSRIGKETMIRDLTFVGQLKGSKGVCGFSGLRKGDDHVAFLNDGIAVA